LEKGTYSEHTGMAVYRGINPPELVRDFSVRAKTELLELADAERAAVAGKVDLLPITGQRGLIGALAAIGFASDPDEAVKVYA
jgi:tRNA(Ile2) C34 agmatinyltransferase TiaS